MLSYLDRPMLLFSKSVICKSLNQAVYPVFIYRFDDRDESEDESGEDESEGEDSDESEDEEAEDEDGVESDGENEEGEV